jgi:hypothetical protein
MSKDAFNVRFRRMLAPRLRCRRLHSLRPDFSIALRNVRYCHKADTGQSALLSQNIEHAALW